MKEVHITNFANILWQNHYSQISRPIYAYRYSCFFLNFLILATCTTIFPIVAKGLGQRCPSKFQWFSRTLHLGDYQSMYYNENNSTETCVLGYKNFFHAKLSWGPLDEATSQIPKDWDFLFQTRFLVISPFCCHGNQSSAQNEILWRSLKDNHPVKFGKNPSGDLRDFA